MCLLIVGSHGSRTVGFRLRRATALALEAAQRARWFVHARDDESTFGSVSFVSDLMIGSDMDWLIIVAGRLYASIPRGETPEAMAIIGLSICGGVRSLEFFFFFFDFFEPGVAPGVVTAGLRETSILSGGTPPPCSAP